MIDRHDLQVLSWQQNADAACVFQSIAPEQAQLVRTTLAKSGVPTVVLATCHRFEIYWTGHSSEAARIHEVARRVAAGGLSAGAELHSGERGLQHAMMVASGMQSLRQGEPEILGQIRLAWRSSHEAGTSSAALDHIIQRVIAAARHIRRHLGQATQWSIGDETVRLLERELAGGLHAHSPSLLIVGAGAVGASVAQSVRFAGRDGRLGQLGPVHITNRSDERARELAQQTDARPLAWEHWHDVLERADLVVLAARSASPLIDRRLAERVMKSRGALSLWIDLASPRNVAPDAEVKGCRVLTLRDLHRRDDIVDAKAQQALQDELARVQREQRRRSNRAADSGSPALVRT